MQSALPNQEPSQITKCAVSSQITREGLLQEGLAEVVEVSGSVYKAKSSPKDVWPVRLAIPSSQD